MSRVPKLLPCPTCKSDDGLDIYTYDNGWRHVECGHCWLLGPGEGSMRQAALSYNERVKAGTIHGVTSRAQGNQAHEWEGK